ncbi:MAG: acireductone synthase [Myxococcota bacterium]
MKRPDLPARYRAVLLDIEGTTTSISFVYDTLFPFARDAVSHYLCDHWDEPGVRDDVRMLRDQARRDVEAGVEGVVPIPEGDAGDEAVRDAAVANVHWQMERDRKTTALKTLQGHIWRHGYRSGEIRGHVYTDVPDALAEWEYRGIPVYIYSSGSVEAQRLLFGASDAGDLTHFISGYFDTTTGPKKESDSYRAIAAQVQVEPEALVFVTDDLDEARAAREAGLGVVVSVRPGNPHLPEHDFPEVFNLVTLAEALRH